MGSKILDLAVGLVGLGVGFYSPRIKYFRVIRISRISCTGLIPTDTTDQILSRRPTFCRLVFLLASTIALFVNAATTIFWALGSSCAVLRLALEVLESLFLSLLCVRQGVITEFDWIESRATSFGLLQGALSGGHRIKSQFTGRFDDICLKVARIDHFYRIRECVIANIVLLGRAGRSQNVIGDGRVVATVVCCGVVDTV